MRFDCVCRRPAVSTITTSRPRARAASTASNATAAGSAPRGAPTKSAPARSAQISSCSSAAARNVSAAPTSTERPCSRSLRASLPIVVVLPVPFTPTTRITLGFAAERERRRLAEQRLDLLDERVLEVARDAARLESPDELGGRRHADVAADERLLEPLPRLVVGRVEAGRRELGGERPAALRERLAHARRRNRCARARPPPSTSSPRSSAQVQAHARHACRCAAAGAAGGAAETTCETPSGPIVTP